MYRKYKIAYACGVDWQHECGETNTELFESVEQLKRLRKCWETCGIVKLRISLDSWVKEQNLGQVRDGKANR